MILFACTVMQCGSPQTEDFRDFKIYFSNTSEDLPKVGFQIYLDSIPLTERFVFYSNIVPDYAYEKIRLPYEKGQLRVLAREIGLEEVLPLNSQVDRLAIIEFHYAKRRGIMLEKEWMEQMRRVAEEEGKPFVDSAFTPPSISLSLWETPPDFH